MLERIHGCVIIPTYNNSKTLKRVLDGVLKYVEGRRIIIVNDGATDGTQEILKAYADRVIVLGYPLNKGKGYALRTGFAEAQRRGFKNAITIDSDGQHLPEDIPRLVETAEQHPGVLLMGSRDMGQEGVPGKSSFGNKFSNFWFWVDTGIRLPDTQTGFRLYPLTPLGSIRLFTSKFETEIEVIVKMAWQGVRFLPVPIRVVYDPAERVSHFRPLKDFSRISILNTWFFLLTLFWYLPKRLLKTVLQKGMWNILKTELYKPGESAFTKSVSIGFGIFMGIVPIWGFQLITGIAAAVAMRLNKVLFVLAAHISIPPMIPIIVYASFKTGAVFYPESKVIPAGWKDLTLESIHLHVMQYVTGAILLAVLAGFAGFLLSLLILRFNKGT